MQSEKYRQLIDRLIEKTDRRRLEWRESAHPDSFQLSFPNYSLLLIEKERPEGFSGLPPAIMWSIVDMNGSVVDTLDNFEIDGDEIDKPYRRKMQDLYRMVRQQALGADKAVAEILSELGE